MCNLMDHNNIKSTILPLGAFSKERSGHAALGTESLPEAGADLGDAVHGRGLLDGAVGCVCSRCGRPKDRDCGRRIDSQMMLCRQLQHVLSTNTAQH